MTSATIFLTPEQVAPFVNANEAIPVYVHFVGTAPALYYSVGQEEAELKPIPLTPYQIQKEIYEKGQRFIKKWELKTKETAAEKKSAVFLYIFVAIFLLCGAAVFFLR